MPLTGKATPSRKAVFLDRDGTLNKNTHYLIDFEDFELLPGVIEGLRLLQNMDYRLFVVSNQSGVARGYFSYEAVEELHGKIREHLAGLGIRLEELVFCPHHPEGKVEAYAGDCDCRKPKPGMIRKLAAKYDIDMAQSIMVGDNLSDAMAGINAGVGAVWLRPESDVGGAGKQVDNPPNIKEFVSLLDFAEGLRDIDRRTNGYG
jgi:D-glycero-D-manno-heptose 1,7-bisphosphate phosphatase